MMKDVELLLYRSQSCRGITVIDKANKSDFVGGTVLTLKGNIHITVYGSAIQ